MSVLGFLKPAFRKYLLFVGSRGLGVDTYAHYFKVEFMAIRTGVGATGCSRKWSGRSLVRMSVLSMLAVAPITGMHELSGWGIAPAFAQEPAGVASEKVAVSSADRQAMIDRAVGFLRKSQAEDGSFSSQGGPGVTGLVVASASICATSPAGC